MNKSLLWNQVLEAPHDQKLSTEHTVSFPYCDSYLFHPHFPKTVKPWDKAVTDCDLCFCDSTGWEAVGAPRLLSRRLSIPGSTGRPRLMMMTRAQLLVRPLPGHGFTELHLGGWVHGEGAQYESERSWDNYKNIRTKPCIFCVEKKKKQDFAPYKSVTNKKGWEPLLNRNVSN